MNKLKAKHVVFGGIAVMMSYVLYHNERFLVALATRESVLKRR